ncbi:MAG: hypothetical protein ACK4YM_10790 [Novosphingobium sp.]
MPFPKVPLGIAGTGQGQGRRRMPRRGSARLRPGVHMSEPNINATARLKQASAAF